MLNKSLPECVDWGLGVGLVGGFGEGISLGGLGFGDGTSFGLGTGISGGSSGF